MRPWIERILDVLSFGSARSRALRSVALSLFIYQFDLPKAGSYRSDKRYVAAPVINARHGNSYLIMPLVIGFMITDDGHQDNIIHKAPA